MYTLYTSGDFQKLCEDMLSQVSYKDNFNTWLDNMHFKTNSEDVVSYLPKPKWTLWKANTLYTMLVVVRCMWYEASQTLL